jgi:hypothetical protein
LSARYRRTRKASSSPMSRPCWRRSASTRRSTATRAAD